MTQQFCCGEGRGKSQENESAYHRSAGAQCPTAEQHYSEGRGEARDHDGHIKCGVSLQ